MRRTALALSLVMLSLTVACGDDEDPADTAAPAAETTSAPPAAETTSAAPSPAGDGEVTALNAVVGEEDDPDAFTIALTDESGEEVSTLPAGEYEISVTDYSSIHNFHLTGEGVEETTTVPEIGETTWTVTFEAGDYTYVCDPHPPMRGEFTVT